LSKKNTVVKAQREMTHRQLSQHQKQQRRQRIIFFGGIAIIVAVALIIAGGWFAGEYLPLHATILKVYDTSFDNQFFIDTLVLYGRSQSTTDLSSMASNILDQIKQNEIVRIAAEKLGITVTDEEAIQYIASTGWPITDAFIELARGSVLTTKIRDQYFGPKVPTSDVQLLVKAMLVESATLAQLCKEQILNGANFTQLVEQYALDTTSKDNSGDYGWHPISIFKDQFNSTIPYDYLTGPDIKAGDISYSLADNTSYKKMGYWLIRVNERTDNTSANVSAILLPNEEQALAVRARLLAGEELGPIADNLSQYNPSIAGHGELGILLSSDNVSAAFNGYAFNPDSPLGEWSQPLKDNESMTRGGVWVIWVEDKDNNKPLTTDDLNTLIGNLYSDWTTEINNAALDYVVSGMTEDLMNFAILKATNILTLG
jgi:parvulin-like peptidyl-prolyl isomerase